MKKLSFLPILDDLKRSSQEIYHPKNDSFSEEVLLKMWDFPENDKNGKNSIIKPNIRHKKAEKKKRR